MDGERVSRNDPCPCGSGKKYKHCCLKKEVGDPVPRPSFTITDLQGNPRYPPKYPIGTVALYGPDDKTTTKIAAGVITGPTAEPIIERWVATEVTTNPKIQNQIKEFFMKNGVETVIATSGNMDCPHEEGEDFPDGDDCPFCPFWKGKQGNYRRD